MQYNFEHKADISGTGSLKDTQTPSILKQKGITSFLPADFLLQQALIDVEPGQDFSPGGEGFIRWNFSTSAAQLESALSRLAQAVGKEAPYAF